MPHRPGSWYGISMRRRTQGLVFLFVTITVVAVVAVATPLIIYSHHSSLHSARIQNNEYPSRYTGLLRYTKFCNQLTVQVPGSTKDVEATLYLLNSKPTQTKTEIVSFNNTYNLDENGYISLSYYLLPNSTISLNACAFDVSPEYYLVKGQRSFSKWEKDRQVDDLVKAFLNTCSDTDDELGSLPSYTVKTEDVYYVIIAGTGLIKLETDIFQILYTASGDTVKSQCFTNSTVQNSCTLPVDLSPGYSKALLELESKHASNLLQKSGTVTVECSPRGWLFAVTGILAIAGVVGIVMGVVRISLQAYKHGWCQRQKKRKSININSPILSDEETSQGYQSL